jgi:hypothetical protein
MMAVFSSSAREAYRGQRRTFELSLKGAFILGGFLCASIVAAPMYFLHSRMTEQMVFSLDTANSQLKRAQDTKKSAEESLAKAERRLHHQTVRIENIAQEINSARIAFEQYPPFQTEKYQQPHEAMRKVLGNLDALTKEGAP